MPRTPERRIPMLSLILFISKASKFGLSCRNPAKNSVAVSARETRSTAPWTPPILIENYGMAGLPSSGVGTCALTASQVTTKSFQVSEYLLCPACEERLRLGGEDWVLANGCRGPKTFPLQSVLAGATPVANLTKAAMIGARTIPEIDLRQLAYFAISVFWRASACPWKTLGQRLQIDLGPYSGKRHSRTRLSSW